jgi:hypothetical protein
MPLERESKTVLESLGIRPSNIVEMETGEPSTVEATVRATAVARLNLNLAMAKLSARNPFFEYL